ncbi:BtrH N-terminal domain-containing protein [Kribbella endophytica]
MTSRPALEQWYRDPVSCLQSTLATLLLAQGQEPLEVLGLGWGFLHLPGDVRAEEFYWPTRTPEDPIAGILTHHPVTSRWRAAETERPLEDLRAVLAEGRLPVVAVDNYHLPFRPAYHDVHSAHLLVISAIDEQRDLVRVSDAMPPAYQGALSIPDLLTAWTSPNPREQEAFFSGAQIRGRWLDIDLGGPYLPLDRDGLRSALRTNAGTFAATGDPRAGLAGLAAFSEELVAAADAGNGAVLEEAYTFGWGMQAQSAVHGELLRDCAVSWKSPGLAEAGRRVEQVAHAWTPVRVTSAYGRVSPQDWIVELERHTRRLQTAYRDALATIDEALEEL